MLALPAQGQPPTDITAMVASAAASPLPPVGTAHALLSPVDGATAATTGSAAESCVVTTVAGWAAAVVHTALVALVAAYVGQSLGVVAAPAVGVGPQ